MDKDTKFILKLIASFLLPPLALYDKGWKLIIIDIILCFFAWLPAIILSLFIVLKDRGVF